MQKLESEKSSWIYFQSANTSISQVTQFISSFLRNFWPAGTRSWNLSFRSLLIEVVSQISLH